MSNVDTDFSYLNNAIREDEIKRSKGKMKIDIEMEKKLDMLKKDVQILAENKIPLDIKGNEPNSLYFEIDSVENLEELLNALEKNNSFRGILQIKSKKFTDNLGLKLAKIINVCKISLFTASKEENVISKSSYFIPGLNLLFSLNIVFFNKSCNITPTLSFSNIFSIISSSNFSADLSSLFSSVDSIFINYKYILRE